MTMLAPGTTLAGYRIERVIGRGGMSTVFEARQLVLDRSVAIKVLNPDLAEDPSFRARFIREARVVASLDHPNILPIYESGESSDLLFIAMPLVRGVTLKQLIAEGPPDAHWMLDLLGQVAAALDYAHNAGLTHRDIKPQNILIDDRDSGHASLADFGLATQRGTQGFTRTGQIMGTVDYLAPEQIAGEPATPAADVYSFGCVMFEALTGSVPFLRETAAAALFAHMNQDPPSVTDRRPDLPKAIDPVIACALAKDPSERPRTAPHLVAQAVSALVAQSTGATPRPVVAVPEQKRKKNKRRLRTVDPDGAGPPRPPSLPPSKSASGEPPESDSPSDVSLDARHTAPPIFRLAPTFRYVHDPLVGDDDGIPLLGNEEVIGKLQERILYSNGGAFLITGFRGVGKTTVIARAMDVLRQTVGEATVLPVRVNVARPRTVAELLFEIIRRVFETLDDERVLGLMSEDVQRELLLAYARTSLSFNESRSQATERARSLSASLPTLLDALTPKLELSSKSTTSLASQVSFLAYTEADVEHDFMRIVSLVERGEVAVARRRRWGRRRRAPVRPAWQGKLVVIVDELDKLTADEDGLRCVTELLSGLKNLLTARGVHFLFVAGPDLHDVALRESRRGNSVFESVFSWQFYVPCLWDATDRLLDAILGPSPPDGWLGRDTPLRDTLRDYLRFKSRGVPRLLLMELNALVRWDDEGAYVDLDGPERPRIQFYADLERVVGAFVEAEAGHGAATLAIDQDRWWLGAYYVTDWVLQSGDSTFTAADLVRADHERALDPVFTLSEGKVTDFLAHLAVHEVVRVTRGRAPDRLFIGDAPRVQEDIYELAPDVRARLARLALVDERERAGLAAGQRGEPWADSVLGTQLCDRRYELLERIGRGENGTVYRARDQATASTRAIKLLKAGGTEADGRTRARFERGAALAQSFTHPNIVRTHSSFEDQGMLGLVMDLVEGTPLNVVLKRVSMTPGETVSIALSIADAIAYVAQRGAARLDLKPANVLLDDHRQPIVVGVDLVRAPTPDGGITSSGVCLATPAYGAPEQLRGEPVDIRADIYALGLIMYEMITRRRARRGTLDAVFAQAGNPLDLAGLRVSSELREVLATATAPRPEGRFSDAEAMIAALRAVPELGTTVF